MDIFNGIGGAINSMFPGRKLNYGDASDPRNAPQTPQSPTLTPVAPPRVDPQKLATAIRTNETGGEKNPYAFSRPSGSSTLGNANGAYQVTDGELKTYAPRFLGMPVSSQTFLQSPALQDRYIKAKISSLASRGLTPEQIFATHRGGMSDLTAAALQGITSKYKGYVDAGMLNYNGTTTPTSSPQLPIVGGK